MVEDTVRQKITGSRLQLIKITKHERCRGSPGFPTSPNTVEHENLHRGSTRLLRDQVRGPIKAVPVDDDLDVLEIGPQSLHVDLDAETGSIRSRDFARAFRRQMIGRDVEGQALGSKGILAESIAFEPGIRLERRAEREV